jgi:integrase
MYREPSGSTRYLTVEEEHALCTAIGPPFAPWIRLAILTGMRRSEQFTLRWADIDLTQGLLTLRHTKAGHAQHMPLNDEATHLLEQIHAVAEARAIATPALRSAWVFPSQNPATPIDPCNFYRRYLKAVKEAGLEGITWHALRHTFASRLAMSGVTEYDIASCLRHAGTSLVRRYAHLSPTHLRAVVERVSTYGNTLPPASPTSETGHISAGTVTGTGKIVAIEEEESLEVLEK